MAREHNERVARGKINKVGGEAQSPKPEQIVRNESVAEKERKDHHTGIVQVRIVSYRSRLLDPDNLCPKYFIDCLRYAGLIKDDNPEEIELSVKQVKVGKKEERTEIELFESYN